MQLPDFPFFAASVTICFLAAIVLLGF